MSAVTVGVLFRNNKELVAPFFYFLRRCFYDSDSYGLVVVDNGSTDGTVEVVGKHMKQNEWYWHFPENVGIAAGRNKLLELNEHFYGNDNGLLLVDSDVFILQENSVLAMVEFANSKDEIGIVYGKNFLPKSFQSGPPGFCFCYIKPETIKKVGRFDERFQMFYDDSDYQKRLLALGDTVGLCERAVAFHFCGQTTTVGVGREKRLETFNHDKKEFETKWNCKDEFVYH